MRIKEETLYKNWKMRILSAALFFLPKIQIKIECLGLNTFPAVCDVGTFQTTQCNSSKKGFKDSSAYLNSIEKQLTKYFKINSFYWNVENITDGIKKYMVDEKSYKLFVPYAGRRTVFTGFKFTYNK